MKKPTTANGKLTQVNFFISNRACSPDSLLKIVFMAYNAKPFSLRLA